MWLIRLFLFSVSPRCRAACDLNQAAESPRPGLAAVALMRWGGARGTGLNYISCSGRISGNMENPAEGGKHH